MQNRTVAIASRACTPPEAVTPTVRMNTASA